MCLLHTPKVQNMKVCISHQREYKQILNRLRGASFLTFSWVIEFPPSMFFHLLFIPSKLHQTAASWRRVWVPDKETLVQTSKHSMSTVLWFLSFTPCIVQVGNGLFLHNTGSMQQLKYALCSKDCL